VLRTALRMRWFGSAISEFGLPEAGEAVGTPVLAADAMMDEEQPFGIVLVLHGPQSRIIGAPVSLLRERFGFTNPLWA
jgi:hypothetical protein